MQAPLTKTWKEVVKPLLRRPTMLQVAALCYRMKSGKVEVLLVTSRGTKRWILPKGWPIDGKDTAGTALIEAWEEAGVRKARATGKAIGRYPYVKKLDNGAEVPCEAEVIPVLVEKLSKDYPERKERRRQWVTLKQATKMVTEPELARLLKQFKTTHSH